MFMDNAKLLKHVLSRIMKNEYSFIKDVNVTAERDMHSRFANEEKNVIYNVWFGIEDWEPFDDWKRFEDKVISIRNGLGLEGKTRFYYTEAGSEDSYYDN